MGSKSRATRRLLVQLLLAVPLAASPAQAAPQPIHEDAFVSIGGIEQWVTIHGTDRANPVVLMVHGGPGNPMSPYADAIYGKWETDFTLVQWDQRGAGRTYGRSGESDPSKMTIEQFAQDGIDVAQFLTKHLGVKKVILQAGSWGSILAVHMIKARPDLFAAYVGNAQLVDIQENYAASFARVLALATEAKDQDALTKLQAIGPPPWHQARTFGAFRRVERTYENKRATLPPMTWVVSPEYAGPKDQSYGEAGDDYSFVAFVGMTGDGPFPREKLTALGTKFDVPIYIIQGAEDLVAIPANARRWFDALSAPDKAFVLVPNAAHGPNAASVDATYEILKERAAPKTK